MMRVESAEFQMIIKAMLRSVSGADCSTLAEIIRDVRRGDETGWKRMVDECVPVLRDMAQEVLPTDVKGSDSEDIAGDVLVKFLGKLPSYAIDETLSELSVGRQAWTYLAKIAFSIIRERYFRGRTTKRPQSVEAISDNAEHADPVRQQNSQCGVPETVARKDKQDFIRRAVEELSEDHRAVIVLFDFKELPACEVAKLLTPDAVAKNQRRIAEVQEEMETLQAEALQALSPKDKAKLNELENRLFALDEDGQQEITEVKREIESLHVEAIQKLTPNDQETFQKQKKQLVALKRDGGCSAVCSRHVRARTALRNILARMLTEEESGGCD